MYVNSPVNIVKFPDDNTRFLCAESLNRCTNKYIHSQYLGLGCVNQ